jgi:3-mercaptopyruvate sulfurtransferase SseA
MLSQGSGWWRWTRRWVARGREDLDRDASNGKGRVSPEELAQALAAGRSPLLIDIRSPAAFAAGHLPGAINVPLAELACAAERLDGSVPAVVY